MEAFPGTKGKSDLFPAPNMHFVLDEAHKEQWEQTLPNLLAVELLSRTLRFLFCDFYFQVYQRYKFGSFFSLSAVLCWLHHTKITTPRITVYSCLSCRKCETEHQYMVYEYANAKLNVLERPFKRTATTVKKELFFLFMPQESWSCWREELRIKQLCMYELKAVVKRLIWWILCLPMSCNRHPSI